MPVSFPFRAGMTLPTALAAPVEAGMMFWAAPRPSRHNCNVQFEWITSCFHHDHVNKLYLARRSVDGLLGSSDGMDSGHQTFNDAEVVVDHFGQWGKTVGGAGGIGNNLNNNLVK